MPLLTLGFSTMASRLQLLIESIPELDPEIYEVLIGVQGGTSPICNCKLKDCIRVIYLDSYGLSRNRNAVIKHTTGDYIWFLDDDIRLASNAAKTVVN